MVGRQIAGMKGLDEGLVASDHPDLDLLLADPGRAAEVPAEEPAAGARRPRHPRGRCRLVRELLITSLAGSVETKNGSAGPQLPYALREAASLLLKSPTWLRRQAKAGAIPCAKKVGKSWQFPRASRPKTASNDSPGV